MPFVNGVYQPDPRSPIERLYGFRQKQAEMEKMQRDQEMQKQRLEVLRGAYTPEQAAVAPQYETSTPMRLFGLADEQQAPAPRDLVSLPSANAAGAEAPQAPLPQSRMVSPGREAKAASFDMQGAIDRLYSIGDLEGAEKLENNQYKSALSARGGASKFGTGGDLIRLADGSLVKRLYSTDGSYKDIPIDGQKAGQIEYVRAGGKIYAKDPFTNETTEVIDVTMTPDQAADNNPELQAEIAGAKEGAKTTAEIEAKTQAGAESAAETAGKTIGIIDELIAHPGREFATGKSGIVNVVPGTDGADFVQKLEQLSGQTFLSEISRLKGLGALSDSEGRKLSAAAAALSTKRTDEGFLTELKKLRSELEFYQRKAERLKAERTRKTPGSAPKSPAGQSFGSMPNPAQYTGKKVRDTSTGIVYQSNGKQWLRVK